MRLSGGRCRLVCLLCSLSLLLCFVMADRAAYRCTGDGMVTCDMPGNAADCGACQAASLGCEWRRYQCGTEQNSAGERKPECHLYRPFGETGAERALG
jgi:hypothetical protein